MGFFFGLFLAFLAPLLFLVVYIVVDEFRNYQKLAQYRKQGVKVEYVPILGLFSKFLRDKGQSDPNSRL